MSSETESKQLTTETRTVIETQILKPTILCDMNAKHEILPELTDDEVIEEYVVKVLDSFDKESLRYESVLKCLEGMREQGLIN